ncbi:MULTISPECIES: CDP-glycerol glycerophosphotransferase family protein [Cellulomonas]|uniref:CDP-glycerol:poly(Glycerophosphate) glycerophosphotransferase n=1 Tax=Cellulomonas gilvus (strain ATCC 13127 / NRRL B-14078) TaxID=593907 RepID=F8A6R6_CELGA|nr:MULTISPECIES: CDP-glycerol glycerophosphotransferase family protein [Cellulomonas]AEI11126.1 CDP-glycerol:poly(glycerophosphate) glycerophosphotransferase [Cellulomonas gilvus ATCC 13127]MCR6688017.1 CDP-glycerol glycerophosphotransferase family protein [Cellulomonas sp.]
MIRRAFFESWRGRYADSPRAISELLAERHPDVRQYWVAAPGTPLPAGVVGVRRHSPEYFARLLTADLVVANDIISQHRIKGPRATYLQTWHGTALKTIGHDEAFATYSGAAAHRARMVRDVAKWDLLLSPAPEATRVFRGAFGFDGTVLETGYPRNDVLLSDRAPEVRARVRAELGIADGRRAVLYAPTWRDDSKDADGRFVDPGALDLARLRARLGDDVVVLLRLHTHVAPDERRVLPGFVVDVSRYPEIADLYLASDVLVSDYSSAIFDYVVTGKPVVLFAYDLDAYRDAVRGMYYDYDEWAPGPVTRTTDELADVLAVIDDVHARALPRYAAFVERFAPHEDGRATQRVLDALTERGLLSASSVRDRSAG